MSRKDTIYYDRMERKIYDEAGRLRLNQLKPYIVVDEKVEFEMHLINSSTLTDVYTGFAGESAVTPSAVIKNSYNWVEEGVTQAAYSGAVTEIVTTLSESAFLNAQGELTLINDAGETETIEYTAVDQDGTTATFTVDETLDYSYAEGDDVTLPYIPHAQATQIETVSKDEGVYNFHLDGGSAKLLDVIKGKTGLADCFIEIQFKNADAELLFAVRFPVIFYNLANKTSPQPDPADTSLYRTSEDQDAIDAGKLDRPVSADETAVAVFDDDRQLEAAPVKITADGKLVLPVIGGTGSAYFWLTEESGEIIPNYERI
jgi:hypothetical protein